MKNKAVTIALLFSLLLVTSFNFSLNLEPAKAATSISGIVSSDTTWTKASSPIDLNGPTRIANGVTVTVEAGTTIHLNSYNLEVNGELVAVGARTDPIQIRGESGEKSQLIFSQSSTPWNEQTGTGCIIQNAIISSLTLSISGSPKIADNTLYGGQAIATVFSIDSGAPIIECNFINGGYESTYTIYIEGGSPQILNNKITGYVDNGLLGMYIDTKHIVRFGASTVIVVADGNVHISNNQLEGGSHGISINKGTAVVQRNLFGTFAFGAIGLGTDVNAQIRNNTFTADSCGISGVSPQTVIAFNNIENTYQYDIKVAGNGTIDALNNWWGTTNASAIASKMESGTVNFTPFLTAPNPQAQPTSTPTPIETPVPPKPTATTVSTSTQTVNLGDTVGISGTVVNGESIPIAGVTVTLSAVDPNGTIQHIAAVTTDASGIYSSNWTPPIEGQYTVTANYAGNQTYSNSQTSTIITVGTAPSTSSFTPAPTQTAPNQSPTFLPYSSATPPSFQNPTVPQEQTSVKETPLNIGTVALIAAATAIIVCAVAVLVRFLRKKP